MKMKINRSIVKNINLLNLGLLAAAAAAFILAAIPLTGLAAGKYRLQFGVDDGIGRQAGTAEAYFEIRQ